MKNRDRTNEIGSTIVAFRAPKDLLAAIEAAAAEEGISNSDIMRRACMRDLRTSLKRGTDHVA